MGFNEPFFDVGVKASLVVEEYAEERRFNTLIHSSGLFNSRTGINGLNQFNVDEGGLTVSLDPSDGSIQKLYAEDTQLIIWQEDKVSRSPIDKDFIFSAEGGAVPVTSSTQYLGTIAPYAGEYGISRDPGSFAVYGTRKYFTDKNRGVVLRLSNDGLTEINKRGMNNFFRTALRTSNYITASFDEYHDVYNLTIYGENYNADEDVNIATGPDGYFTIAFEEDVAGWSSFKTIPQECGTTLNNRYYTLNGGDLYEHNSTIENTRNRFYGVDNDSEVQFIFNDSPSSVKEFKTLGYEGTDGWDCEYLETDSDGIAPGSEIPVVSETSALSLNLDRLDLSDQTGSLIARLGGVRRIITTPGETARWILFVEAIRPTEAFTELTQAFVPNLSDRSMDFTGIAVSSTPFADGQLPTDNLLQGRLNVEEGRIYFDLQRMATADDQTLYLGGEAIPVNIFVGSFLTVAVTESIQFATVSVVGTARFTVEQLESDPAVTFDIIPEFREYYIYDPNQINIDLGNNFPIARDAMNNPLPITTTIISGASDAVLRTTLNVTRPANAVTRSVNVSGAPLPRFDVISFNSRPVIGNIINASAAAGITINAAVGDIVDTMNRLSTSETIDGETEVLLGDPSRSRPFTTETNEDGDRVVTIPGTIDSTTGNITITPAGRDVMTMEGPYVFENTMGITVTFTPENDMDDMPAGMVIGDSFILPVNDTDTRPTGVVDVPFTVNNVGDGERGGDRQYQFDVTATAVLATFNTDIVMDVVSNSAGEIVTHTFTRNIPFERTITQSNSYSISGNDIPVDLRDDYVQIDNMDAPTFAGFDGMQPAADSIIYRGTTSDFHYVWNNGVNWIISADDAAQPYLFASAGGTDPGDTTQWTSVPGGGNPNVVIDTFDQTETEETPNPSWLTVTNLDTSNVLSFQFAPNDAMGAVARFATVTYTPAAYVHASQIEPIVINLRQDA